MRIVKADGTVEEFKPQKLKSSLRRAGAGRDDVSHIVGTIEGELTEGARTQDIYTRAFSILRDRERGAAAKYSLRRAIFNLGPTGFPFEDFLARLFEADGYVTKRRILIRGKCATHEIDIAAYRNDHSFVGEAKFHMSPGIKSDLQVAMYSYARFLDLQSHHICREDRCGIHSLYVITNTKFTETAKKYAQCTGIKLLSWDYPRGDSLQDRIERHSLYPITVLTTLSVKHKQLLIASGIILCRDLFRNTGHFAVLGIPRRKIEEAMQEASLICGVK